MNGLNKGAKVANFGIWSWFFGRVHGRPHFIGKWREASGIHHFHPISSWSPMLFEHRPSHLTKGTLFLLNHTILTSYIGGRKLMFETQITTKGFEMRVFKFAAIVTTNSSNSISMSLVLQPQD
jgi:hypothetical protein